MPLCTLEIPRDMYHGLPNRKREQIAIDVCNAALDTALSGLGIPDPEDREYRIITPTTANKSDLTISLTVGTDEYGTGDVFDPSVSQVRSTAEAIHSKARDSQLYIHQAKIETWRDTTFRELESGHAKQTQRRHQWRSGRVEAVTPKFSIALSPAATIRMSDTSGLEGEFEEMEIIGPVVHGIIGIMNKFLNVPAGYPRRHIVLFPAIAETDISVEVDFPSERGTILEVKRNYLAKNIEAVLNRSEGTREGSATIWIRQGQPDVEVFPARR